jgi:hypothetical protein
VCARARNESGQSTVEWTGLVLLVAILFGAVVAATEGRVPGAGLAGAIADKLVCAAKMASCEGSADYPLVAQYGEQDAMLARRYAPELRYEDGSKAVPVDYRHCRSTACGDGRPSGAVLRTDAGLPVTAFTHVVHRNGNTYVQYWLYYANSATYRGVPIAGKLGYHEDDWESYQVRIGPGPHQVDARSSSHHGYNGNGASVANWASDTGVIPRPAWTHARGRTYVSGGSHAGHATENPPIARFSTRGLRGEERRRMAALNHSARNLGIGGRPSRWTPSYAVHLVPIEPLVAACDRHDFAISPPWCKPVYADPENEGT